MSWGYSDWAPYVPVEARRRKAAEAAKKLAKKQNRQPQPVTANGLKLAKTFWGRAWCDHLHTFHDYANRLPRGATYLRNGSVVDLVIHAGRIEALVAGSETYQVAITIQALDQGQWKKIREHCSRSIESLLDLLSGRLSEGIMRVLTDRETGLFPKPREIRMRCNCPDGAAVCKHLAAVMYGVGARLDTRPELLFQLRGVDQAELVSQAATADALDRELGGQSSGSLGDADLGAMFGIELDLAAPTATAPAKNAAATRERRSRTNAPAGGSQPRNSKTVGPAQPQRPPESQAKSKSKQSSSRSVGKQAPPSPRAAHAAAKSAAPGSRPLRARRGATVVPTSGKVASVAASEATPSTPKEPGRAGTTAGKIRAKGPTAATPLVPGDTTVQSIEKRQATRTRKAPSRTAAVKASTATRGSADPSETSQPAKPRSPRQRQSPANRKANKRKT